MSKRVIVTEWNTISSEETSKLVQSMPKRLTEVLRQESNVIKYIKIGSLRFTGHICRTDTSCLTFRIFNYKPIGTRTRGRHKLRWADCVEDDFKVLKVASIGEHRLEEVGKEEDS
ncbi:hypothetical protein TNCV_4230191 [Trichonephila clavipes]|uniref:Uncharacterized protein n=1 Tax=Trichonephila clavipes TaxID=2585209 RepID=A0A8X6SHZ7_TRICX|nr:hypothetical protein TNCV_4230191 [Trichonephila clavipes]